MPTVDDLRRAHRRVHRTEHKPGHFSRGGWIGDGRRFERGHGRGPEIVNRALTLAAARGWTQAELARRACLRSQVFTNIRATGRVSHATVGSLAVALDVHANRLLPEDDG